MMQRIRLEIKRWLAALRLKLMGPFAKAVVYDTSQGKFALEAGDFSIGRMLGFNGSYNEEEIKFLEYYVNKQSQILVVGAHVGTLAVPLAANAACLTAIEANPTTYSLLQMNVWLNGLSNITTIKKAAGNKSGTISFLQSSINSGGSKIKPVSKSFRYIYDKPTEIEVEMVALDEEFRAEHFNLIIMDIEGAEPLALQGCQRLLKQSDFLYIEFYANHLRDVFPISLESYASLITPHFSYFAILESKKVSDFMPTALLEEELEKLMNRNAEVNIFYSKER